jgi:hypothetical protein
MRCFVLVSFLMLSLCTNAQDSIPVKRITAVSVIRTSALPLALVGYGVLCVDNRGLPSSRDVKAWRDDHFPSFKSYADDYLFFSNGILLYGFDVLGIKSKSDVVNQSVILAKTSAVTAVVVSAIKYTFKTTRPDQSNNRSFPSGHTALAFAYATVLHKEFKDASPWISVLGYSTAAATGTLRVLNNKHWFSDVIAGAGIGILSTNLVYLTHQYKFSNSTLKNSGCLPIIGKDYYGLMWQKTF